MWKILFIVAGFLALLFLAGGGSLWYNWNAAEAKLELSAVRMEGMAGQLSATSGQLELTEARLTATGARLEELEKELGAARGQAQAVSMQLKDVESRLTTAENRLTSSLAELETAKGRLADEEQQSSRMLSNYASLREQVNLRLGRGQDIQKFITPLDPAVAALVQELTGGYSPDINERWRDIERMYNWVEQNIKYSYDTYTPLLPAEIADARLLWKPEFWKLSGETLEDRTGDCEDVGVLLASMLLNYHKGDFTVWLVGIIGSRDNTGHVAVAFPGKGGKLTILDPSARYATSVGYGLGMADVGTAVNNWLSYWRGNMPGAQVFMAFSQTFYREFSGTEEFVAWAKGQG